MTTTMMMMTMTFRAAVFPQFSSYALTQVVVLTSELRPVGLGSS